MNRDQLNDFAHNAQAMINAGTVEDRLRHYLSSMLVSIFPDYPWWVRAHIEGTEERVRFSSAQKNREGFVDAVVGKTAIEYEKNLTVQGIFNEGYFQVKEYCAALYNIGIPESDILGVLSDTVRWYGYSVKITGEVKAGMLWGADNVVLEQIAFVDLSIGSDDEYSRFEQFINHFMARNESRLLNANTLVTDFGSDSSFYREYISVFSQTVNIAMKEKPDYAILIRQVWQNFIAYLGGSDYGSFSTETYVSEFYLVTVAKVLCANILAGKAIVSSEDELKMILNGEYFSRQNIYNLVDYDYFGWLNDSPFVDCIIHVGKEMQARLHAYDFSRLSDQDIFGKLLAQLADREHRLMLGQEFTPRWIAKYIVDYNLEKIGNDVPRIMDMCCGSGVFLIESIKAVREKYAITPTDYDREKDSVAFSCVTGFDIDPLAVMLAKVNWIMAMRDLFPVHSESITVPIYHADSLFVATPISHRIPTKDEDYCVLKFDKKEVKLPAFLLSPSCKRFFDSFMSKIYRLAMARADVSDTAYIAIDADEVVRSAIADSGTRFSEAEMNALCVTALHMVDELENLQRQGRNGIWYFIISNSYRPGLAERQFNCLVSNPPWMAMSKLADNPYKTALSNIARKYSIQPMGPSHPHMELATIFLVSSVDRYLMDGAHWSCILPASLMSGLNHEQFRKNSYQFSDMKLQTVISAIWELPTDTFKNRAIVLSGEKGTAKPGSIDGRIFTSPSKFEYCTYSLIRQGKRTAWTIHGSDKTVADVINAETLSFTQGCDLFPRTVIFHKYTKRSDGNYDISPIERTSELWYLISDLKKEICNGLVTENFDKKYMYNAYISKHLSPFIMSEPAKALIPGRKEHGSWIPILTSDLALMNASTAYAFRQISNAINQNLDLYLEKTINIYGKLKRQNFNTRDWLVLSNASGANPCAAYFSLDNYERDRLVIDQTLYWYLAETEDEAIYIVGLLNSNALSNAISDFQPEGGFGKRHIHTLPYKLIPKYSSEDELHNEVIAATKALIDEWKETCMSDVFRLLLDPNSGTLNSRRKRQQSKLRTLLSYKRYDEACSSVLGWI